MVDFISWNRFLDNLCMYMSIMYFRQVYNKFWMMKSSKSKSNLGAK